MIIKKLNLLNNYLYLPPESRYLLPYEYSKLMIDNDSDLIEYYPINYSLNTFNKRYFWENNPGSTLYFKF